MTDLSVTNYNPYNFRNNVPVFRGKGTASYNTQVQFTSQPDSFTSSKTTPENNKKRISNKAMALSAIGVLGLGALAYVLTRGKVGNKSAQHVAEQIEFKPAKTIEEAKAFAQEKLKVLYNDIDDVGTINFINEWLTGIRNNPKLGGNAYPRIIYKSDCRGSFYSLTNKEAIIDGKNYGFGLGVNTEFFNNFKTNLNNVMDEIIDVTTNKHLFKKVANNYSITQPEFNTSFVRKLLDRINKSTNLDSLSYKDKWSIYNDLIAIQEGKIVNGNLIEQKRSLHTYLNHELGHLIHNKSISNYEELAKIDELKERGKEVSHLVKEFITDKAYQATAGKVSNYAKESPLEFVAETFAGLLDGKTYSDDVMALYKKYGGPSI